MPRRVYPAWVGMNRITATGKIAMILKWSGLVMIPRLSSKVTVQTHPALNAGTEARRFHTKGRRFATCRVSGMCRRTSRATGPAQRNIALVYAVALPHHSQALCSRPRAPDGCATKERRDTQKFVDTVVAAAGASLRFTSPEV